MTPAQLALLKQNLIAAGLLPAGATDDQTVAAANSMQQSNPDTLEQMMRSGPSWLTIVSIGAGALAIYLVWSHYSTQKLGEIERPEPDTRRQLRGFSKSLGRFASGRSSGSCRMGRKSLGSVDYEFEPEIRLEGHRSKRRKGARR